MKAQIMLASGGTVRIENDKVDVSELKIVQDVLEPYKRVYRFGGQVYWTDWDHIQFGLELLGPSSPFAPYWILHEAGEPLGVGDVNFMLKPWALREVDERLIEAVVLHGGFQVPLWENFKNFDRYLGYYEASRLFPEETWRRTFEFYGVKYEEVFEKVGHNRDQLHNAFNRCYNVQEGWGESLPRILTSFGGKNL